MCGDDVLLNVLPNRWIGLCALVRMKTSVVLMYDRVNEMPGLDVEKGRVKRSSGNYVIDKRIYVDAIGQREGFRSSSKHAARWRQDLSLFCHGSQLTKM